MTSQTEYKPTEPNPAQADKNNSAQPSETQTSPTKTGSQSNLPLQHYLNHGSKQVVQL